MVSVAVVNALQDTMSVGESLKWGFTLEELVGCFSRIMVLIKFVSSFLLSLRFHGPPFSP